MTRIAKDPNWNAATAIVIRALRNGETTWFFLEGLGP